jgi:membrane protein YdbS with pleckstrin-like domain
MPGKTTVEQYPLEARKVQKRFLNSIIAWLNLFAILLVAAMVLNFSAGGSFGWAIAAVAIVFLALCIWQYWYEIAYYKGYFYDAGDDFFVLKKGVITPRETNLPWDKMQDVYVDQDILDRMFTLWDVHVSTATALSGFEAHIDGVSKENAAALKELLLNRIRKNKRGEGNG